MITTPGRNTSIRRRQDIAHIRHGTVSILITCANAPIWVAIPAGANDVGAAGLSKLLQTNIIATISPTRVAIVASFAGFENRIATARIDTNIGIWRHATKLAHRTIGIRVTRADITCWIAKSAGACRVHASTRSAEFEQTNAVATVAIHAIAVVATFGCPFLTITTNGASQRSTSNWIGKNHIERTATIPVRQSSGAIGSDIRAVVR